MKVNRVIETETNCFKIGDQIHVGHYTATCQEITQIAAIFLLDQYLDKPMEMNAVDTNNGGYLESDLRKRLQSNEAIDVFKGIRYRMVPFENGDLLRIPFAGEMFGDKLPEWCKPDGHEQWPLMQDRRNRLASRQGKYEWGWLQNKRKDSATNFCFVGSSDYADNLIASAILGVRPVFKISMRNEDTMTQDTTKKSAPENEETILDTFNEKQRLVLYYLLSKAVEDEETVRDVLDTLNEKQRFVNKAIEGEETILDVLDTLNDKQRLVLKYFVNKAAKDAKKGKTSKSNEEDE